MTESETKLAERMKEFEDAMNKLADMIGDFIESNNQVMYRGEQTARRVDRLEEFMNYAEGEGSN